MEKMLERLAADYPQLYLNPDTDSLETYRAVVLRGESPQTKNLSHYRGHAADRDEITDTPAGPVRVVTLGCRQDFELVMRGLLAAKSGPLTPIPESEGAAMLTVFNWPRIHAHLAQFPEEQRSEEFSRFTADRKNYIDMLVVLSRGPYSNVSAELAGCPEEEWLSRSDTIRRYHELTHVICRRSFPGDIDSIRDELVADAVGLYAAYGRFDPRLEQLFLGIRGGKHMGGRLSIYTKQPEQETEAVCAALNRIYSVVEARPNAEPFNLIPALMEACSSMAHP